jgi:HSP20 family protein
VNVTSSRKEETTMKGLQRRDPLLAELDAMSEGFERLFGLRAAPGGPRGFLPPCDIWETEQAVVIELDAPGLHPENISAEVVDGQLVVTGERSTGTQDAVRRYRSERWQGRFVRSFTVPAGVDGESIKADYRDGVLILQLPKPETAKPKRIAISHTQAIEGEVKA